MSTRSAAILLSCQSLRQEHNSVGLGCVKQKPSLFWHPDWHGVVSYPSPPMSDPPSPTRVSSQDPPLSSPVESRTSNTDTSIAPAPMPQVTVASPASVPSFYHLTAYAPLSNVQPAPSFIPQSISSASPSTSQARRSSPTAFPHQPSPSTTFAARPTSSKGGRKSKAHVASACVNCKRAHLSCDVSRPCARCIASGKQDTCFDVQHKKRGRPRLREEGEFKVAQTLSEAGHATATAAGGSISARSEASTRHRRQESFRSLRSQDSDGSGVASSPSYPYPPPPTATRATFDFAYPAPPSVPPGFDIPTAYLDLDLVVIKANLPWRQVILGGQDVAGRLLSDLVAPADGESLYTIRNKLRSEREARDPAYMPPINQAGAGPLQEALTTDVERYAQGFDDNTYRWTQTRIGSAAQVFPARVRLAKTNAYFVAVTLPSFWPLDSAAPQAPHLQSTRIPQSLGLGTRTQTPDTYGPVARSKTIQPTPPSGFEPLPGPQQAVPAPLRAGGQKSSPRTYPPVQHPTPVQEQQQLRQQPLPPCHPALPRVSQLPTAEIPTVTTAFTPRTAPQELPQFIPSLAGPQLAPIVEAPAVRAGPAVATESPELRRVDSTGAPQQQSEDTDDEGTLRKRRRMGIDDVLHR